MKDSDLERELDALIDGTLDAARFEKVQQRLNSDPEALELYLSMVRKDHLLKEKFSPERQGRKGRGQEESENVIPFNWSTKRKQITHAVAAMVILGFLLIQLFIRSEKTNSEELATGPEVEFAPHAIFEAGGDSAENNGQLREGDTVVMQDGFVSVTLGSGVEAVIESPSRFSIVSDNRVQLDQGQAWFRVPKEAVGFTVVMPFMEVVDLGTIFSTEARDDLNLVTVSEGRVEVRSPDRTDEPKLLEKGESLTLSKTGDLEVQSGAPWLDHEFDRSTESLFHDVLSYLPNQPFDERDPLKGAWEIAEGSPSIADGKFASGEENALVFGKFAKPVEPNTDAIVLLSFRSQSPERFFHSKGWAGVSLFDGDKELLFLGDKSNDSYSWALIAYGMHKSPGDRDILRHDIPVQGSEESFTIRYLQRTGDVEIFHGWGLHGIPVVRAKTDPNLRFDRLRVASGKGGDFSFDEIKVSVSTE